MRIAIIHTRLLHRGGLETRLFSYMRFLRDAGHEVTVIVYKVGKGVSVEPGVRLLHLPLRWVPKMLRAWVFDRKLKAVLEREQFDFVLSLGRTSHHDAVLLPGNHLGYLRAMGLLAKGLSDAMQILMDRKAYQAPGVVLACSEMMKREVVELYKADPSKIRVLHPPTDTHRFHAGLKTNGEAFRSEFGMRPGFVSCVLVSASHGRKGLPFLLQVFAELKNEPFELLVAGQEAVETNLPNVRGIGFVKDTQNLYAAADCTVLPALYEPFGQVVSESILCGTPVLVSGMVGARDVIGEEQGRVLEHLDVQEWVAAIRAMRDFQFSLPEGWADLHGISLQAHMARILECAGKG